jgi:hypothetical protein
MSHTPFIVASYLIGSVLMLWTALAPVFSQRSLLRHLQSHRIDRENKQ